MTKRIVILGAGYGGLKFAQEIEQPGLEVMLIDRNPYHTLLVEIHQVASGLKAPDQVRLPLAELGSFTFMQAEIAGIDPQAKTVKTDRGYVAYDYLVFALGSVDNDFGVPGVRAHAQSLRNVEDAMAIRQALATLPEDAHVVIAGGGLTGVELAAELGMRRQHKVRTISLVEASPAVLPALPGGLQRRARARLGQLGVNVLTGSAILAVEADRVHLASGTSLHCNLLIWTGGVKANPLVAQLGVALERGRVKVDGHMLTSDPSIYVVGDSAAFPLPPSGQLAEIQGALAARHLSASLKGREVRPLKPRLKGTLVDLGHQYGVGEAFGLQLSGRIALLMKRLVEWKHVVAVGGLKAVFRLGKTEAPARELTSGAH